MCVGKKIKKISLGAESKEKGLVERYWVMKLFLWGFIDMTPQPKQKVAKSF
jgi:hypothetical protein